MQKYEVFNFKNEIQRQVIFINTTEELTYLKDEIYEELSKNNGTNFKVIVDLFLRNGFSFNRYVMMEFKEGKSSISIINHNEISENIKRSIRIYLKENTEVLNNGTLSKRIINFIKYYSD